MFVQPIGASRPGLVHQMVPLSDVTLHVVTAGSQGSSVLLVHGFPETWWVFNRVIPLLAERHRVVAVDLRGFGDSSVVSGPFGGEQAAEDLRRLIVALEFGPVHVVGQDISGSAVYRLAATWPGLVSSLSAIEMGLPGFGLERFADMSQGGVWHIGVLASPGVSDLIFAGKERDVLQNLFASMMANPASLSDADLAEFARTYARPGGWHGAGGLYRSMLREGEEVRALASAGRITLPVLAIGAGGGAFTRTTMTAATGRPVKSVELDGIGHYAALEAPAEVAQCLLDFLAEVDQGRGA